MEDLLKQEQDFYSYKEGKIVVVGGTNVKEEALVRSLTMSELLNDSNINTLVELSDVQFSAAAVGRHYFEETNNVLPSKSVPVGGL